MSTTLRLAPRRLNRTSLTTSLLHSRSFASSQALASRLRQPGEPTGPNEPPSHVSTPKPKKTLNPWNTVVPIVAIFFTGTFLFKKIVDQRKGQYKATGPVSGHSPSRP
ncbi:hypothetical protein BDV96DRAFT_648460 [Lophiotrema nucula]|uniref:Uncharacterized protein n=1 Tax=Lophiotrema nucula TaxID=690887 RepID=A0A6A5Z3D2_9PLEO|nr:hypothetical protein BDV96DRAFT_648460 [Lophiotrema nucula]